MAAQAKLDKEAADIQHTQAQGQEAVQRGKYYEGLEAARQEERRISAEARKETAKTAANQRSMTAILKGREQDAVHLKEGQPVPAGYETIQDLENPGFVYAVPPAFAK